ncbi:PREDICTED: uncharacterized protein LOC104609523 isoform X2 [Nelumbo nucifera]|uniref:Uncharacterized protein LOC104609523 isoform X2 n=1 Tax=Nelumbo nucifera TaxID=4432 RepID=A0A1U8BC50_NELNU|nr:PREDICTED: uncharacterized protein LOC104609523 isoform X2 [Nelumbo nucifera]
MHLLKLPSVTSPQSGFSQDPRIINRLFPPNSAKCGALSIFNRKGIDISAPKNRPSSLSFLGDRGEEERLKSVIVKEADVVTLGNLCVDIVLNVPELPPASFDERLAYMEQLSASKPDKRYWEAGGNCNMAIAAARLGLKCLTLGHVGNEIYGHFLLDVLHDEGIGMVGLDEDTDSITNSSASYETLICWVLVDPLQRHGFCSRADFSKEPAFSWLSELSGEAKLAIKKSKILFCNGYGFDELSPSLIMSVLDYAMEVGTSIFFDPGPRGKSLSKGTPEQKRALDWFLRTSDVLLLTSDEVNVIDTVGCGDSFVAAIAFGFLHDMPTINILALANAVGAATAMGCGAGRNVATLESVIELIRVSNLNDDDEFWSKLLHENMDTPEISLLSRTVINGSNDQLKHVSLQKVVSDCISFRLCRGGRW